MGAERLAPCLAQSWSAAGWGVLVGVCAVNVNGTVGFSISVEDGGGGQM